MGLRVLVTRPEPGTSATASRLRALGHAPVVLPLTRIDPLASPAADGQFSHVIATSANALRHAAPELLDQLKALPLLAVGEATADAAMAAGFEDVRAGDGGADSLVPDLERLAATDSRIAYLCGSVRRDTIEAALVRLSLAFEVFETYSAEKASYSTQEIDHLLAGDPVDAVLIHSLETGLAYVRLPRTVILAQMIENADHIAISGRVAEGLSAAGIAHVTCAESPSDDAMLAALAALCRPG